MQMKIHCTFGRSYVALCLLISLLILPYISQAQYPSTPYIAWSPDGRWVAFSYEHRVDILDIETMLIINSFTELDSFGSKPVWSPNSLIIGIVNGATLEIWEAPWDNEEATQVASFDNSIGSTGAINSASWHPDGEIIAISSGTFVSFFDLESNTMIISENGVRSDIISEIVWHPSGDKLAVARLSNTGEIWEYPLQENNLLILLDSYLDSRGNYINPYFNAVDWSHKTNSITYTGVDKLFHLDLTTLDDNTSAVRPIVGQNTIEFIGHVGNVYSVDWHPTENLLATGGEDGTVRIWDVATGEYTIVREIEDNLPVVSVVWSPNGSQLAFGDTTDTIEIVEIIESE